MSTRGRAVKLKPEGSIRETEQGKQMNSACPAHRFARFLRLLCHGDKETALATFYQQDQ
jgi:hypothetical protein